MLNGSCRESTVNSLGPANHSLRGCPQNILTSSTLTGIIYTKRTLKSHRQFTVYTTEYCFELQSLVSWYRVQEGSTVMDTSRSENNFVSRIGHVPLVNRFDLLVSYSTDYEYYNLTDTLRRTTVPGKIWFLEFSQL